MFRVIYYMLFVVAVLGIAGSVFAGSNSTSGWAWGGGVATNPSGYDGMGWISFSSSDCDTNGDGKVDVSGCGVAGSSISTYSVSVPEGDGDITGYAWSEHYGWISFNASDLAGCTPLLFQAHRTGNSITGGARILAIRDAVSLSNAGGYDGCISLNGVSVNGNHLDGSAWSSDLGWIDITGVKITTTVASPSLAVCPDTTFSGVLKVAEQGQLHAYYRTNGAPITCGTKLSTDVDVTQGSNWTTNGTSVQVNDDGVNKGKVTALTMGSQAVSVSYNSTQASYTVTVAASSCPCACDSKANQYICNTQTYTNDCGKTCTGAKGCQSSLRPQ